MCVVGGGEGEGGEGALHPGARVRVRVRVRKLLPSSGKRQHQQFHSINTHRFNTCSASSLLSCRKLVHCVSFTPPALRVLPPPLCSSLTASLWRGTCAWSQVGRHRYVAGASGIGLHKPAACMNLDMFRQHNIVIMCHCAPTAPSPGDHPLPPPHPAEHLFPRLLDYVAESALLPPHEAVANVLKIGHQLLAAAAYMHTRGVVHADIKPDNILMGAPGGACAC